MANNWLFTNLCGSFSGDDLIRANYGPGSSAGHAARKWCGVAFKDGLPDWAPNWAPDCVVDMRDSDSFDRIMDSDVIVPIGDLNYNDHRVKNILRLCAERWFNLPYDLNERADYDAEADTFVVSMYYGAIESLILHLGQCDSLSDLTTWFHPLLGMVRVLAQLHFTVPLATCVSEKICRDFSKTAVQKGLAHVILGSNLGSNACVLISPFDEAQYSHSFAAISLLRESLKFRDDTIEGLPVSFARAFKNRISSFN